jgi:DNA polymerase-1
MKLGRVLAHLSVLTVVHNALFDLKVMEQLGIRPRRVLDTMIMAYLLGESSLKLKVLAYRYAQMEMRTYEEVVRPESERLARPWLERVMAHEWEDSEPVIEENPDGTVHVRQPQNLSKRLKRFLTRYDAGTAKHGLVEYWTDKKMESDRDMVESVYGEIPIATLADVAAAEAVAYACADSDATMRIFPPLMERIHQMGLEDVLERDMAILPMVLEMMHNGMLIDPGHFAQLSHELEIESGQLQIQINKIAGAYLNPSSPPKVLSALQARGLQIRSTKAEELDKHRDDELVRLVQDYRGTTKLRSTYGDVLPKLTDVNGRVHTSLSVSTVITGRLSSKKPNLQNQPVRSETGRKIREGFMAGEGNLLLAFDLSQIELRYAAHESRDPALVDAYWSGKDIHTETAMAMFGLKAEEVDSYKHRRPGKTCNFGMIYMISPPGLLMRFYHEDITEFTEEDCARFIEAWKEKYAGYFDWAEETKSFAIRHGYVVDMFGRRRWVPEVYSVNNKIREGGLREAVNAPVTSGAQGYIKECMRRLCPKVMEWRHSGGVVMPLLQVHDELIFEVREELVDAVVAEFAPIMEHAVELIVPVGVGVKVGKRWGSMKEIKG